MNEEKCGNRGIVFAHLVVHGTCLKVGEARSSEIFYLAAINAKLLYLWYDPERHLSIIDERNKSLN